MNPSESHHLWFGFGGVRIGQFLFADLFKLLLRECRLFQDLRDQLQNGRQTVSPGFDADVQAIGAPGNSHLRLQPVELVLDLLAVMLFGSTDQSGDRDGTRGIEAHQAADGAEVEADDGVDGVAARLLGKQRNLHPIGHLQAFHAGFDVGRGRIENLTLAHGRFALVILHERIYVRCGRNLSAIRLGIGNELSDGAVGTLEVGGGHALYIFRRYLLDAVAVDIEQTPIALSGPLAHV